MLDLLKDYWTAVRETFPEAWGQPPRRSRLMHGVGIISMGFVMDAIVDRHRRSRVPSLDDFTADLARLKDVCRWTSGSWELGPEHYRRWNDLQNTPRDIQLLTNFLLFEYKTRVWSQGRSAAND
jgi:hypothetical protein